MRTENSARNLTTALLWQGLGILVSLFSRMTFVHSLSKEYLGINGLFTELLTMLSLVEMGIGPAINYNLYKPLAEKDYQKVHALMSLYQKAYVCIGFLVMLLSVVIMPFLHLVIKNIPDIPNIRVIFMLFAFNSAFSFFFSYKRSLIIADQNQYIATTYRYGFYIVLNIFQMLALITTQNYLLYLILQIICTVLENIAISLRANRMYPFLKDGWAGRIDNATASQIVQNTKAMVMHRIGGIAVNSTDNLLISTMLGVIRAGLYSNYQLITRALQTIINQMFASITSSIGNLGVTESPKRNRIIFNALFFLNFWIIGLCSTCFYILVNPFIDFWIGEDMLLLGDVTLILAVNFYVSGMRRAVLTFRDALGLYWYDRYKSLIESIINIAASILLAPKYGMTGILYGTFISTMTTCFWVEPHVLYKYGFKARSQIYFFKYAIYTSAVLSAAVLTGYCCGLVAYTGFEGLFLKAVICTLIPNGVFLLLFHRTEEFRFLWGKVVYLFFEVKLKFVRRISW